ncbi:hypothetical protein FRC17_000104 [Serendipita sp. 399]|nr:hypothetical protein FRC17_000104 [Serendipita sp. 399]
MSFPGHDLSPVEAHNNPPPALPARLLVLLLPARLLAPLLLVRAPQAQAVRAQVALVALLSTDNVVVKGGLDQLPVHREHARSLTIFVPSQIAVVSRPQLGPSSNLVPTVTRLIPVTGVEDSYKDGFMAKMCILQRSNRTEAQAIRGFFAACLSNQRIFVGRLRPVPSFSQLKYNLPAKWKASRRIDISPRCTESPLNFN